MYVDVRSNLENFKSSLFLGRGLLRAEHVRLLRAGFCAAAARGGATGGDSGPRGRAGAARGEAVLLLGARFDRILVRFFQQISQIFANLEGLVLGCIEADFCNQILILQHFSRSTK